MGKIVEFLGNSGSGKTTLVGELAKIGQFDTGIELHPIRPFHNLSVEKDPAYALANQVDFLLYRAEQEKELRSGDRIGLLDGGLEQDFCLYTALFKEKGYLDSAGYTVCERLYRFFRAVLGEPDLIVWLDLPVSEVLKRFAMRGREFEVTQSNDLNRLDALLRQALQRFPRVIRLDANQSLDQLASQAVEQIIVFEENR